MPHLARLHNLIQGAQGLFKWRLPVRLVNKIEVEIIRFQVLKTLIDGLVHHLLTAFMPMLIRYAELGH